MIIRLLLFFILISVISLGIGWLVDNNGQISMIWLGHEIKTSTAFAISVIFTLIIVLTIILQLISAVIYLPANINKKLHQMRLEQNLARLKTGYLALLSGDMDTARNISQKLVTDNADSNSVMVLSRALISKVALEDGDEQTANLHLDEFAKKRNTRFFAVKGKLDMAFKTGDINSAITYAEQAYKLKPKTKDGAHSLLELYKKAGYSDKAENFLRKYSFLRRIRGDKYNNIAIAHEKAEINFAQAKKIFSKGDGTKRSCGKVLSYIKRSLAEQPFNSEYILLALKICHALKDVNTARNITEKAWVKTRSTDIGKNYLEVIAAAKGKDVLKKKLHAIARLDKISADPELSEDLKDIAYSL